MSKIKWTENEIDINIRGVGLSVSYAIGDNEQKETYEDPPVRASLDITEINGDAMDVIFENISEDDIVEAIFSYENLS